MDFVKTVNLRADFFSRIIENGFHYYNLRRLIMPGGDRTGPMGQGPMTGRGAGFCSGNRMSGYAGAGWGRGFRGPSSWNFRGGRGWRNRFYAIDAPVNGRSFQGAYGDPYENSADAELQMLKEQADFINERIKALESASTSKKDNA